MITAIALAIGTLGPASDVPQHIEVDCVRTEPAVVRPRKPATHKPVHKTIKRLFKSEPKIIEEGCETLPPAAPIPPLFDSPPPLYSVPVEPLEPEPIEPAPIPVADVPPCDCFGGGGGFVYFGGGGGGGWVYTTATPAVPEPAPLALIGLGLLAQAFKSKPKKSTFSAARNADS